VNSRPGINVIGYASAYMGLGTVAREFTKALQARGHPVAVHDLDAGDGRSGADDSLRALFVPDITALPHELTLWVIGAASLPSVARRICREPALRRSLNAAFVWWELPDVPPAYQAAALAFDALVTGSEFVREAWAMAASGRPVLLAPHPLDIPDDVMSARDRFGLDPAATVFYCGFEAASDPERKNPFGAVEAFKRAFPGTEPVQLAIKVNNPNVQGRGGELLARLYALVEADPRFVLIRERLAPHDLLSLYASCDATVSLHRSEGLGLMPLEGMRLGVPAIATGWSGNMTYMTHSGAALVRYSMAPNDESCAHYAPRNVGVHSRWAEPEVDHAASWMRRLQESPDMRHRLAAAAKRDALAYDARARRLDFMQELAAIAAEPHGSAAEDLTTMLRRLHEAEFEKELFGRGRLYAQLRRFDAGIRWRTGQLQQRLKWRFAQSNSARDQPNS
jgi:glycosyltransferase involved in cell wall biosynthesis